MKIKLFIFILLFVSSGQLRAQELFVYSEPASNMATKSIGLRANNYFSKQPIGEKFHYFFYPEIMVGVSKKLMLHAETFFSNSDNAFAFDGASLYGKYRIYSDDAVHNHFRVAVYGKGAVNKMLITQPAIDLTGFNSGVEIGAVATKLMNKIALSAGTSVVHAFDNLGEKEFAMPESRNAVNYNLAFGKLMLPMEYTSYNQTNLNVMIELLGQSNLGTGRSFIDIAPSLQLIFLSRMRLDLGYRFPIITDLKRNAEGGLLVRFEYNIFNAYK